MKLESQSSRRPSGRRTRGGLKPAAYACVCALVFIPIIIDAQQRDATTAPAPAGTAEISGVVLSADSAPQPMRRAVVTLSGGVPTPRSVITDDAGRFTFGRLAAGTYQVVARKAAYIAAPFGARKPGRTGMPVVLADGQRTNLTITMFRGASISGQLRDAAGAPVSGVDVRAMDARTLLTNPDAAPVDLATTDDRGMFKIYGLLPGDYYVVALPLMTAQGETVAPSASHIDSALAMLAGRQSQSMAPAAPQAIPARLSAVGFAPIFFPGTPNHYEAARVHVESGEDRSVNFEITYVTMGAIEGVVSGNVPNLAAVRVTLIPSGPRVSTVMSSTSLAGRPIDEQGRFRYSNLPPGRYRVVARADRASGGAEATTLPTVVNNAASGGRSGGAPTPVVTTSTGTPVDYLYGFADVELRGEDQVDVSIGLQPGGTMSGRIVFAGTGGTPRPADLSSTRPTLSLEGAWGSVSSNGLTMGTNLVSSPPSKMGTDGTFEIRSIGPGRFNFSAAFTSAADPWPWKLRSAVAGGRNLLDDAVELGPGMDVKDVVVTFSDARTEIAGTLQSVSGQPTTDYYIVVLPADRTMWRTKSRRVLSVRPSTDGRFVFVDPPAGEYLIAALTDLDPLDLLDPSFLEQIAPAGVKLTVAEGERKIQDLRIR